MTQSGDGDEQQNANTSEHPKDTSERVKSATGVLQECNDLDADLRVVIEAWLDLPPNVKRSIVHVCRNYARAVDPAVRREGVLDALRKAHTPDA